MRSGIRAVLLPLWMFAIVTACSPRDKNAIAEADLHAIDFDAGLRACCPSGNQFSPAVVDFTEANSMWILPFARNTVLRPAYLQDQPDAHEYLLRDARPLDLITAYNGGRLSGLAGEGYFGHMAVYLGTEPQLKAMGVWNHPAVAKFHDRIRAGGIAIEAVDVGVRLATRREVMEVDAAALFRPTNLGPARKRQALIDFFTEIGQPFDFHFDLATENTFYCSELVNKVLPELKMPVTLTYGRPSVWPDEMVTGALLGEVPARFQRYIFGNDGGWDHGNQWLMAARIIDAWPSIGEL